VSKNHKSAYHRRNHVDAGCDSQSVGAGRLCTAGKESVRGPISVELQIKPGLELTLTCHSGRTDYDH